NQIRRMAAALKALNLPEKSNIAIISKNCAHWIMSDLAIMMSGHVSVPLYPTLNAEKTQEILLHSQARVIFIGKLDNWAELKEGIPENLRGITYPQSPAESADFEQWDNLIAQYEPLSGEYRPHLDELATIIYTSGTTGMSKGVMHSYYTLIYPVLIAAPIAGVGSTSDRFFSYLPLSHIAERALIELAGLYAGGSISFVESIDSFRQNLVDTLPTVFLAVPRIWTKFQQNILEKVPQKRLDALLSIPLLSGIIRKKIKKSLGLNQARCIITGAAPMPLALLTWFRKLGINIQEAYGMTENVGCCTFMRATQIKTGTVGQAYPQCTLKIDPETGEILMKAEWITLGYYREPKKTAEIIKDGWLHTGDMGELDAEGFLKITGRIKDQFKGAKGEFIVPGPIEAAYATNHNIEQICVIGRGMPQPIALVVLSELGQKLAQINWQALEESLEATRDAANRSLVSYEKIQKIITVKEAWSVENQCLTPTLKIKRNVLEEKYGSQLENWYDQKKSVIQE
ncbi:MAG: AMP-binding protein, partial [Bacteroidia bacterium]|nr:AMP-binding protein [Bacteroidia bacterium]